MVGKGGINLMDQDTSLEKSNTKGFVQGEIVFTIYENANEHFSIAKIKIHDTNEDYKEQEIVGKGHFINLQKGVSYQFYGQLTHHAKFGVQYDITSYQTFVPETEEAVIAYLSSDIFHGIGKKTAESIVEHLGENAIKKILEQPNLLDDIPNLNKKTKKNLITTLQENQGFEAIAVELTRYGIGLKMAQVLYKQYGEETLSIIHQNPYQFIYDIEGFGFLTADKIAEINRMDKTNVHRLRASCIYALQMSMNDGHVFLPLEECLRIMHDILMLTSVTDEELIEQILYLNNEKHIIKQDDFIYLASLYYAEDNFSGHIRRVLEKEIKTEITDAELMKWIGDIEEDEAISYGVEQFEAIKRAIESKLMLLTGGPGTGKTTVIKGILKVYATIHDVSLDRHDYDSQADFPFILTAPTGRAAKRLQESTGIKATTIHRLLGWDGHRSFEKNEHEKLSGSFLIIDEFSMVDIWLANQLFKAVPDNMQILMVGDEDQLPSVGPGEVLADLFSSKLIPNVTLNEVYRQKEGSKIIQLAHLIKQDQLSVADLEKAQDFSFIPCETNQVADAVTTIIQKAKAKGIDMNDIQILAPMYRTVAGINTINEQIQEIVNPKSKNKRERQVKDATFRVGDRVIQLVNQPEDGVYNGDIGEIIQIFRAKETEDKQEQILIAFDDNEVLYSRSNYFNFKHAYCISIHKSQGSEFPIVILPVVRAYRRMLKKNLLYTAITRSKQSLILCGEMDEFFQGVETLDTNTRNTTLQERLVLKIASPRESKEVLHVEKKQVVKTPPIEKQAREEENEHILEIDPNIEDDGLSPYDFM